MHGMQISTKALVPEKFAVSILVACFSLSLKNKDHNSPEGCESLSEPCKSCLQVLRMNYDYFHKFYFCLWRRAPCY